MLNLQVYGSAQPFTLTHQDLVHMVSRGPKPIITDQILLNAFRQIDRADFLPEDVRDLAYLDRLLKVGYGEVSTNPTTVAKLLQAFRPKFGEKYLHLGTGTGYLTSLLGFVAGDEGKVYSMERIQWLWERAREFSAPYRDKMNVEMLYRDARAGLPDKAPYDGIIVSFIYDEAPMHLVDQLAIGGRLLYPTNEHTVKIVERVDEDEFHEEQIPDFSSYVFGGVKEGVS